MKNSFHSALFSGLRLLTIFCLSVGLFSPPNLPASAAPLANPGLVTNPNPADGAQNVSIFLADLTWTCAPDALSYEVRFWLSTESKPAQGIARSTCSSFVPLPVWASTLNGSSTYHWQVTAVNASGSTPGPQWSFSTEPMQNLTVSAPLSVAAAADGAVVSFTYTISNTGLLASSAAGWSEQLTLSPSPVSNPATAIQLGFFANPTILQPGQSVTLVREITLPPAVTGVYSTFVQLIPNGFDGNYGDNTSQPGGPLAIGVTPRPDLIATAPALPGGLVNDAWISATITITNQGAAPAAGWTDRLYLSPTPVFAFSTAIQVGEAAHPGSLAAGAHETRALNVHIPAQFFGPYYAILWTDAANTQAEANENNNQASSGVFQISAVAPPPPAQPNPADGALNVSVTPSLAWQPTSRTQRYDVRFWPDGQPRPDVPLQSFTYLYYTPPGKLNANRLYHWQVTAVGVGGSTAGPVWSFTTLPLPDLQVQTVTPPPQAFSGQQIQLSWVTANAGSAPAAGDWLDGVYLSASPLFDLGSALFLGSAANPAALLPGESYLQTAVFNLPAGASGLNYFHVLADRQAAIPEDVETNNAGASAAPIMIQLTPPPDLQVTALNGPAAAFSGGRIQVYWKVENLGAGATRSGGWLDRIYLSASAVFDANTALTLQSVYHPGDLAANGFYTQTSSLTLPQAISGPHYLFVRTDAAAVVYEHIWEGNNLSAPAGPLQITLTPPPDLEIRSLSIPSSGFSGQTLPVVWTVTNNGAGPSFEAVWQDGLYLSSSPVFSLTSATRLAAVNHYGDLQPGQAYTTSLNVTLPDGVAGSFYLHAWADSASQVFEYNADANNFAARGPLSISLTPPPDLIALPPAASKASLAPGDAFQAQWQVKNQGAGAAVGGWRDGLYLSPNPVWSAGSGAILLQNSANPASLAAGQTYSQTRQAVIPSWLQPGVYYLYLQTDVQNRVYEHNAENNNLTRSAAGLNISASLLGSPADLAIHSLAAPMAGFSDQPITVTWQVDNLGGATRVSSWLDGLYLSQDTQLDPADALLGSRIQSVSLAGGAAYQARLTVRLPEGLTGSRYLILAADIGQSVADPQRANNLQVIQPALAVALSPWPDLAVKTLSPASGSSLAAGQGFLVQYRVTNHGAGESSQRWQDGVYLSANPFLDAADLRLSSLPNQLYLRPGAAYTQTTHLQLPLGWSGPQYLLVQADTRAEFFENNFKGDNLAVTPITLTLPAPADLVVDSVSLLSGPAGLSSSAPVTVTWTLRNQGANPAQGVLCDSVFISPDPLWDLQDALLGSQCHPTNLGPGQIGLQKMQANLPSPEQLSALNSLTSPLPGATPGAYYTLVRADVYNNIPESSDLNNAGASLNTFTLDLPALALGVPAAGSLPDHTARFYKLTVPGGQTVQIDLDSAASAGANELYVRFNQTPSRNAFDYSFESAQQPDQTLVIPETISGTYYILAYAASAPQLSSAYSLTARIKQFGLRSIDLGKAGNTGLVTFQVNGSLLTTATHYSLLDALGKVYLPAQVLRRGSTQALLSFDLSGAAPGPADLLAQAGGLSAQLTGALLIQANFVGQLSLKVEAPSGVRRGELAVFYLNYGNIGGADLPIPLLVFELPGATYLGFNPSGADLGTRLYIYAVPQQPLFTRLRPGEMVRLAVYARLSAATQAILTAIDPSQPALASQTIDWNAILARGGGSGLHITDMNALRQKYGDNLATYYQGVQTELADLVSGGYPYLAVRHVNTQWYFTYPPTKIGRAILPINPFLYPALPGDPHYTGPLEPANAPPPSASLPADGKINTFVLLVSDEDYSFRRSQGDDIDDLDGMPFDAQILYNYFVYTDRLPGWHINWLIDRPYDGFELTPGHIKRAIRDLPYDGDDYVVIFYSGHGSENQGDWYLNGGSFTHVNLIDELAAKKPGAAYVIVDACHSGAFINYIFASKGLSLAATEEGHSSFDSGNGIGSIFTSEFVAALNKHQTVSDAFDTARSMAIHYTRYNSEERIQRPQFVLLGGADTQYPWKPPDDPQDDIQKQLDDFFKPRGPNSPNPANPLVPPATAPVPVYDSRDPNDILGPLGQGEAHWIPAANPLGYTIRFENDPQIATGPAQKVVIRQKLDSDLDPRTFRLGAFGFHNQIFEAPVGRAYYSDRLDLRATLGVALDVVAGIDLQTNEAFWIFQAVDPQTGAPPSAASLGFLPPNLLDGEGQGFVSYRIQAKANAPSGTLIDAQATIIFDHNDPMDTPDIFNTLDASLPQAALNPLAPYITGTQILLNWSGSDSAVSDSPGSGLLGVDLYVSQDGGPFILWQATLTSTVVVFNGEVGHTYAFYAQALDLAGSREPAQNQPEARTALIASSDRQILLPLLRR